MIKSYKYEREAKISFINFIKNRSYLSYLTFFFFFVERMQKDKDKNKKKNNIYLHFSFTVLCSRGTKLVAFYSYSRSILLFIFSFFSFLLSSIFIHFFIFTFLLLKERKKIQNHLLTMTNVK